MSLAERLAELDEAAKRPCKFARVIGDLREVDDPDGVDEFVGRLMGSQMYPAEASRILQAEEHPVSESVIRKHVRGDCCCP